MATSGTKRKAKVVKGQDLKDFRHAVSVLKKSGAVSKRVDARSQKATRYMLAKVRKYNDVVEGRALVVKAPKDIRQKYIDSETLEVRGSNIIVPKAYKKQKAQIARGMVQVVRPLKNGQEEYVILPFKMTDLPSLIDRMIEEEDEIDGLKEPGEYFSFRLGENNSEVPFINAREMAEYLVKYATRFDHPISSQKQTRELLTFQRFKTKNSEFMRNPHESGKPKIPYPAVDARGRNSEVYSREERVRKARKKARQRKRETPERRALRLKANAIRSAQWRQRQFEGN